MPAPLILIIEDDSQIGGLVCEVLREAGYRTYLLADANLARSAEVALLSPDAVISDLVVDGVGPASEVARQLNAIFPGVPLTLMTGVPPNRRAQLGVSDERILEKPFELETLLKAVESMVGRPPAGRHPQERDREV
jgi:DNA-binding response OmpR family regulator